MSKRKPEMLGQPVPEETKTRIPAWLYPSTLDALDRTMPAGRFKSRSEFIEEAVRFYAGYLSGQEANAYLPPALVSAINAAIRSGEERICRMLFKLSVEVDMMMNVLAAGMEIPEKQMEALRPQCVRNVKKTHGSISLDSVVERRRQSETME